MLVRINGEPREVPEAISVAGLLALLGVKSERVAVERNAQVVRKALHATTRVAVGDELEIVTFVGGG